MASLYTGAFLMRATSTSRRPRTLAGGSQTTATVRVCRSDQDGGPEHSGPTNDRAHDGVDPLDAHPFPAPEKRGSRSVMGLAMACRPFVGWCGEISWDNPALTLRRRYGRSAPMDSIFEHFAKEWRVILT
jgi:hypothetical protein